MLAKNFLAFFPHNVYPNMRVAQGKALTVLENSRGKPCVLELPVGSGKTAVGYTYLAAHRDAGRNHPFYLVPNKALVDQVHALHPDMSVMYGRNEHPCLYYKDEELQADQVPCSLLTQCPHRVNQESGDTHTEGATPCPYLLQKYNAKHSGTPIVATHAFYLFSVLFSKEFKPEAVVVDEAHGFANAIRSVLSTSLTDWKLERAVAALNTIGSREVHPLSAFQQQLKKLVHLRALDQEVLLEEDEIETLLKSLKKVRPNELEADTKKAVREGHVDPDEDREVLKQIEDITRSVRRFQHALGYAISDADRHGYPLNFVIAYGRKEMGEHDKVQYRITVKDYYVVPIVKKMLPPNTLAYSATISDPNVFSFETGIKGDFTSIASEFPIKNARIFLPNDTPNLAMKARRRQDKTKSLRLIAKTAMRFAKQGHRSLVIVVSNDEREKFCMLAAEEGLDVLSYGNSFSARECAQRFRDGEGQAMVGTVSNFGEGIDLPKQIAPIIFHLRPGYPHPGDAQTQFEERRFGNRRWEKWNWRVIVELLQVRGRNIRSRSDIGVTFLISQQFRRFAYGSLPEWLRPAYKGHQSFEECVKEAEQLLG